MLDEAPLHLSRHADARSAAHNDLGQHSAGQQQRGVDGRGGYGSPLDWGPGRSGTPDQAAAAPREAWLQPVAPQHPGAGDFHSNDGPFSRSTLAGGPPMQAWRWLCMPTILEQRAVLQDGRVGLHSAWGAVCRVQGSAHGRGPSPWHGRVQQRAASQPCPCPRPPQDQQAPHAERGIRDASSRAATAAPTVISSVPSRRRPLRAA